MIRVLLLCLAACYMGRTQSAAVKPESLKLLKEKTPLQIEFCKSLGYSHTSKINFLKQKSQSDVENNRFFQGFKMLELNGCSDLTKPLACAIFAPKIYDQYGALPPCRELCQRVRDSCSSLLLSLKAIIGEVKFYCNHLPTSKNRNTACVEYKYNEDEAQVVSSIVGNPKERFEDWKPPL